MGSRARLISPRLACAATRPVVAKARIPSEDANFISSKEQGARRKEKREKRKETNSLKNEGVERRARFCHHEAFIST